MATPIYGNKPESKLDDNECACTFACMQQLIEIFFVVVVIW